MGKNSSTDVIAFNLTDTKDLKNVFADIVVSTDTAIRNTKIFKTTLFYELCLYVIHGLLHILGYNDKLKKQRQIMEKRQKEILKCLSIKPKP